MLQHWRACHDRELLLAVTRFGWGYWGQMIHGLPYATLAAMQLEISPMSPPPPAGTHDLHTLPCISEY